MNTKHMQKLIASTTLLCILALGFLATAQAQFIVSYVSGDDAFANVSTLGQKGQTFTLYDSQTFDSVLFKASQTVASYIDIRIRATSNGLPTGSDLAYGTLSTAGITYDIEGQWCTLLLNQPLTLNAGVYAILFVADAFQLRIDTSDALYAGGNLLRSEDSGVTWIAYPAMDVLFAIQQSIQNPTPTPTVNPSAVPTIPPSPTPNPTQTLTPTIEPTPDGNSVLNLFDTKNLGLLALIGGGIFLLVSFGGKRKRASP